MIRRSLQPSPEQIRKWIQHNFHDHKECKQGLEIRVHNPLVLDNNYHLWINTEKACVNDFRPHAKHTKGSFLRFVKQYKQISFYEAVRDVMGDNVQDVVPHNDEEEQKEDTVSQLTCHEFEGVRKDDVDYQTVVNY